MFDYTASVVFSYRNCKESNINKIVHLFILKVQIKLDKVISKKKFKMKKLENSGRKPIN